jgi:CRISPR-associated protein Cst2
MTTLGTKSNTSSDIISKAITMGMIMNVDVGNVNAGWTEGVVTVIKKVECADGSFHPYISGQALRHYIRKTMKDILADQSKGEMEMSPENAGPDKKSPVLTEGDPRKYIDDDLFGFMRAIKEDRSKKKSTSEKRVNGDKEQPKPSNTRKRTSPLRVSPGYGIFKLNSDRDLGTRSAIEVMKSGGAGGSIFETEITNNLFRTALLVELDRVGVWKGYETTNKDDKNGGHLNDPARKARVSVLLESLKYLWGGGRQSRFLVDLTPQFIIYARTSRKVPLFLNSLDVEVVSSGNGEINYKIKTDVIKEMIEDYSSDIQSLIVGLRNNQFANSTEDFEGLHTPVLVTTVGKAIDSMISDIMTTKLPHPATTTPSSV